MLSKLVVCRYNENINWINHTKLDYVIYNKGEKNLHYIDQNKIIHIPNIDTEAYVYLRYIVDYYHSLPDQIIFTQGNPLPHNPLFTFLINNHIDKFKDTQPLSSRYNIRTPDKELRNIVFPYLNINNVSIYSDFYDSKLNTIIKNISYKVIAKKMVYLELYKFFKQQDIRKEIMNFIGITPRSFNGAQISPFCYGAIFSVHKHKILNYSRKFYYNLLDKCMQLHHNELFDRRIFGWIMEYGWMELFQYEPPQELYTLD